MDYICAWYGCNKRFYLYETNLLSLAGLRVDIVLVPG